MSFVLLEDLVFCAKDLSACQGDDIYVYAEVWTDLTEGQLMTLEQALQLGKQFAVNNWPRIKVVEWLVKEGYSEFQQNRVLRAYDRQIARG